MAATVHLHRTKTSGETPPTSPPQGPLLPLLLRLLLLLLLLLLLQPCPQLLLLLLSPLTRLSLAGTQSGKVLAADGNADEEPRGRNGIGMAARRSSMTEIGGRRRMNGFWCLQDETGKWWWRDGQGTWRSTTAVLDKRTGAWWSP